MPRSHDDGAGKLVMPALLARIESDPDDARNEWNDRNVVGEVAPDELPRARLFARFGIDDACAGADLAGDALGAGDLEAFGEVDDEVAGEGVALKKERP